jgi:hypothetical protein
MTPVGRLRGIAIGLLALLALFGFAAGAALVTDPTGARLRLTVEDLPSWLFVSDWLVPGVVIAVLFGVLPVVAAVLVFRWSRAGWTTTTAVGLLLLAFSVLMIAVIGLRHAIVQGALLILAIALTGVGVDGGAQFDRSEPADDEFEVDSRS